MMLEIDSLAETVGLEPDEYLELLELYLEVTPSELNKARQALSCADAEELARAAHSVKGSSGNLRLMALRDRAQELEEASRARDLARAKDSLELLHQGFEEIRAEASRRGLAG